MTVDWNDYVFINLVLTKARIELGKSNLTRGLRTNQRARLIKRFWRYWEFCNSGRLRL